MDKNNSIYSGREKHKTYFYSRGKMEGSPSVSLPQLLHNLLVRYGIHPKFHKEFSMLLTAEITEAIAEGYRVSMYELGYITCKPTRKRKDVVSKMKPYLAQQNWNDFPETKEKFEKLYKIFFGDDKIIDRVGIKKGVPYETIHRQVGGKFRKRRSS